MQFLYHISISLYALGIRIAALFNSKAKLWVNGRKQILQTISETIPKNEKLIWFHCASLGEFEQGRPVLESIKERFKEYKILLTFFSPSGYEVRKDYDKADYVFYLPIDTAANARRFISITQPRLAIFVKYEFWYNYLNELSKQKIPLFMVSVIFRPSQYFFKPWGGWFRKQLQKVSYFFVQNEQSKELLSSINVFHADIGGDTRFDRVVKLNSEQFDATVFNRFADKKTLVIAGSTWSPDEDILSSLLKESPYDFKLVLAPHVISKSHIDQILEKFKGFHPILLSKSVNMNFAESRVLIVDSIGILSHVFRVGKIAYIGGGFGAGIHNTLEAATYGLPVIFGPNYKRFQEAVRLSQLEGAFPINDSSECLNVFNHLMEDNNFLEKSGELAQSFVQDNAGATDLIVQKVTPYLV